MDPTFTFSSELEPWSQDKRTWVFARLPVDDRRGFGSIRVRARINTVEWKTSIFPDKSSGSFVLPVKQAVRRQARVDIGDVVELELDVLIT